MKFFTSVIVAVLLVAPAFAGHRRHCQPQCFLPCQCVAACPCVVQRGFVNPVVPANYQPPPQKMPPCAGGMCPVAKVESDANVWNEFTARHTRAATPGLCDLGTDALDEVNAYRSQRGLRPFKRDNMLMVAALGAASYRARNRIVGHVTGGMGDFRFLPAGTEAKSAGCAAWPPSMGWGSCCATDNYEYAGAAWAMGTDGLRYMHLFVR